MWSFSEMGLLFMTALHESSLHLKGNDLHGRPTALLTQHSAKRVASTNLRIGQRFGCIHCGHCCARLLGFLLCLSARGVVLLDFLIREQAIDREVIQIPVFAEGLIQIDDADRIGDAGSGIPRRDAGLGFRSLLRSMISSTRSMAGVANSFSN
jgi:hypothetical protein